MATHSSIRAWKIPWAEEPGTQQSLGLQRVEHNWVTSQPIHVAANSISFFFMAEYYSIVWFLCVRVCVSYHNIFIQL